MGYEGWATTFPPFNDFAKKVLSTKGPVEFSKIFGDYFVCGKNRGAMLNVELTQKCSDESQKESVSAAITAAY